MNPRVILLLVLLSHVAFSQERSIIGRVVESGTEKPIKDANIFVTGTTKTTFTNHLGYFEVAVDRSQHTTLQISHIEFKIIEMPIPADDRFKLYLEKDSVLLRAVNLNQYPVLPPDVDILPTQNPTLPNESEAKFPGGMETFYSYMGNALAPMLPQVNAAGFNVVFTINESGQAVDLLISDSSPEVKAAVTQAFETMTPWAPATQRQKNVRQMFVLPIKRFKSNPQSLDLKELNTFIQRNIKYPAQAKRMGIEGPIFMQFTTDELGNVISMVVLRGINDYCNDEVKRVISIVPASHFKSLVDKTGQREFILPVFYGLDRALKTGRDFAPNSSAYVLPAIDVVAGGLTIQRRELGNGAATTVSGPMYRPEDVTYLTLDAALNEQKTARRLMLKHGNLATFPVAILSLTKLNFLDLEHNQLKALPDGIDVLTDLKELYLPDNKLSSLPDNFANLKKLKTLGLSGNQLKSFPLQITPLEKLEALDLSNNQLSAIPAEIGLLKNLEALYLMNNTIKSIPPEFYTLKNLKKIYLKGNPISPEDLELLRKTFKKSEIDF